MSNVKIVVTGANGQLGKELRLLSSSFSGFDFTFLSKKDLPIHQVEQVNCFFEFERPSFCINCAAYTAVDKAENEKEIAFLINGQSPGFLATACKSYKTKLIHLSTDYVFDGKTSEPLKEDAPTHPMNIYGATLKTRPHVSVSLTRWGCCPRPPLAS